MQRFPLPIAFALAAIVACALLSPSAASAHARYESSSPARGEILAVGPNEVEITFSQDIQRIAGKYDIQVNIDRGSTVTSGPAVVNDEDRTRMSVPLQPNLADGRYVVHWNNVSDEDGDPAEGAFSFYVNYEPNAVDLQNDQQLELIGAEETPAGNTPSTEESPTGDTTPPGTEGPPGTPAATPTAGEDSAEDGGNDVSVILIVIGAIALAALLVGGGYLFLRGRGT
jgi:methionine-rich copper-binding protein CopC